MLSTLIQYRDAYQSLDAERVARVFTGADLRDLRRAFRQYNAVAMQIDLGSCEIAFQGDRASAACPVTMSIQPKAGERITRNETETFRLVKRSMRPGSAGTAFEWVVERIE